MATDEFTLDVWRLHPSGCSIAPADRSLRGTANEDAVRWCGPFTHANRSGWWVFPPVDIDITWNGGSDFEWELLSDYNNADELLVQFLLDEGDEARPDKWLEPGEGRSKFSFGQIEVGVAQIWTGCIFETPPGWGLQVRSPINMRTPGYHVMEAMLETDWLQQDIWINLVFHEEGQRVELRRDQWPPLAQLMPVRKETYAPDWQLREQMLHRNTPAANRVFEYWVDFNNKKFAGSGKQPLTAKRPHLKKDSTTYYRERRRVGRTTEAG